MTTAIETTPATEATEATVKVLSPAAVARKAMREEYFARQKAAAALCVQDTVAKDVVKTAFAQYVHSMAVFQKNGVIRQDKAVTHTRAIQKGVDEVTGVSKLKKMTKKELLALLSK